MSSRLKSLGLWAGEALREAPRHGRLLRVVADAFLVNLALLIAFALRFVWLVRVEGDLRPFGAASADYLRAYLISALVLTAMSLAVFHFSGFYSRRGVYRGRYKALVVLQAVTLTYAFFGTLSYFSGGLHGLPRSAFVLAYALTLPLLVGARWWAELWSNVVKSEMLLFPRRPEETRVKSVLVIGGAGYIGSALVPRLLEKGYQVRVLDLLIYGTDPLRSVLGHRRLEVMQADFRQVDRVVEAMRGVDAVIHLGGIVGDPACEVDEQLTVDVNLMATHMVAEVAKGSGISRFLFASTCSVYGAGDQDMDERSEPNPISLYARSKIASERALRRLASSTFGPTILRFSTVHGISGRLRFDLVVNLLAAKAVVDGEITVHGGNQWRPFLHVDDAARALVLALEAPFHKVSDEVFNVGSDQENYTILRIAERIHAKVPEARVVVKPMEDDRRDYRVRFGKFAAATGFASSLTVDDGIAQVIEAIRAAKVKDYKDPSYSNVGFLREEGAQVLVNFPRRPGLADEEYGIRGA